MRRLSARAASLACGAFGIVNFLLGLIRPELDANILWIDARWLPSPFGAAMVALSSAALFWLAVSPRHHVGERCGRVAAGVLAAIAIGNAIVVWVLLARGHVQSHAPFPFSLGVAALLVLIAATKPIDSKGKPPRILAAIAGCVLFAGILPLSQMATFGTTDYRRPCDAIVVFGARAYSDGRPSDALRDRLDSAVHLFHSGFAPTVVVSGGPGDGTLDEATVMSAYLLHQGVPASCIVMDHHGDNTQATITNVAKSAPHGQRRRILAVSHFYHLPRIKLEGERRGLDVFTSPAAQRDGLLAKLPWFVARETLAWWRYYAKPIA